MVTILVVLAGYALIFGAKGAFDKILKAACGLAIILTFLPGLITAAGRMLGGASGASGSVDLDWLGPVAGILLLVAFGVFAWRSRSFFARRRAEAASRSSSPRERAPLPPPPPEEGNDDEGESP